MFTANGGSKIFMSQKGWIEVAWGPLIDEPEYVTIAKHMITLITSIQDKGQEPIMLIDFSRLEKITDEAAGFASRATKDLGCRKIAGFGIKPQFKAILDLIKERSTKADTIREFVARPEAEVWLLQTD